jgi:transcriptional regulator GlxA family with amidase domain
VKLAFLIYDEFTLLDLAGPVEVLRAWPGAEPHFVAVSQAPVRSDSGLIVTPTSTTESLPNPNLILVPGTDRPNVFDLNDELVHSAGIDMALTLLGREAGDETAKMTQSQSNTTRDP